MHVVRAQRFSCWTQSLFFFSSKITLETYLYRFYIEKYSVPLIIIDGVFFGKNASGRMRAGAAATCKINLRWFDRY